MERRRMIKGLAALAICALMPKVGLVGNQETQSLHIIGLGRCGINAIMRFHGKGIDAKYSCIGNTHVSHQTSEIRYIYFNTTRENHEKGSSKSENIGLTPEMKALFNENDRFIIYAGVKGSTGTELIFNIINYLQTERKNYLAVYLFKNKAL
jgi:hypothetical protein